MAEQAVASWLDESDDARADRALARICAAIERELDEFRDGTADRYALEWALQRMRARVPAGPQSFRAVPGSRPLS